MKANQDAAPLRVCASTEVAFTAKSHTGNANYATAFATMSGCWPITRT